MCDWHWWNVCLFFHYCFYHAIDGFFFGVCILSLSVLAFVVSVALFSTDYYRFCSDGWLMFFALICPPHVHFWRTGGWRKKKWETGCLSLLNNRTIWRTGQHLEQFLQCVGCIILLKETTAVRNTTVVKGCVCSGSRQSQCQNSGFSQQSIAEIIRLSPPICLLPRGILPQSLLQIHNTHILGHKRP